MNDTNTIKTIFYYPKSLEFEDYLRLRSNGTIAPRTIVFAEAQKAIYKDGVQYGSTDISDLKEQVKQIFVENPYTLPVATAFGTISKYHIGGVMAGDFLKVDGGGKLDFDDERFRLHVKETPEWVDMLTTLIISGLKGKDGKNGIDAVLKKASRDDWGVVKIGAGLSVSDGVISVDVTQGQNGQNGQNGRGITSIDLYGTVGLVDTYQITYTDGTHSYFTVTNGASGQDGQGGQDGLDGQGGQYQIPQTILNQLNALDNALDLLNNTANQEYTRLDGLINTLDGKVDQLLEGNIDGTIFQPIFEHYVLDGISNIDLANIYASKDAEGVIEWIYSGLTGLATNTTSFADIVTAGSNGTHTAIADVHTYIEKLKNGDYVSTASIEAKVDEALAGLKVSAGSNTAKTEIFNKIEKNSSDISGILSEIAPGEASVSIATRIGNWKSGLVTTSNIDSAISTMMASNSNNSIAAAILVAVDNGGSTAQITADRIDINGLVTALDAYKIKAARSVIVNAGSSDVGAALDSFLGGSSELRFGDVASNGTITYDDTYARIGCNKMGQLKYGSLKLGINDTSATDVDFLYATNDAMYFAESGTTQDTIHSHFNGDHIAFKGNAGTYLNGMIVGYNSVIGFYITMTDPSTGASTVIKPGQITLYDGTNTKTITASN